MRALLNRFIECVDESERAANLSINILVKFEENGKETYCVLFHTEQDVSKQIVRHKMASINTCQCHLLDIEQINFFTFLLVKFKDRKRRDKEGKEVQRSTYTYDECKSFYASMRYCLAQVKTD